LRSKVSLEPASYPLFPEAWGERIVPWDVFGEWLVLCLKVEGSRLNTVSIYGRKTMLLLCLFYAPCRYKIVHSTRTERRTVPSLPYHKIGMRWMAIDAIGSLRKLPMM